VLRCADALQELRGEARRDSQATRRGHRAVACRFRGATVVDGGAFACRGDGNLQTAAADHRAKKKSQFGMSSNAVDGNVPFYAAAMDRSIHFRLVRGGDDDEVAVEIGGLEAAFRPFQLGLGGQRADRGERFGRDHAQSKAGGSRLPIFSRATFPAPTSSPLRPSSLRKIGSMLIVWRLLHSVGYRAGR